MDNVNSVRLRLNFTDAGSYTFNRIKKTAENEDIYNMAIAVNSLRSGQLGSIFKLVESTVTRD